MESGKQVEIIIFPDKTVMSNDDIKTMEYLSEYYGDHSENWIIVKNRETGIETSRHNTSYITSIFWKPVDEEDQDDGR